MSRWLSNRRAPLVIALIGLLFALPTLGLGYFLDDHFHIYWLDGGAVPGGPHGVWDLYRFSSGQPGLTEAKAEGIFPWWTSEDFRIAFLRPIPSLWRVADHELFGPNAFVPHLETSIVFALTVWAASRVMKRFLGDEKTALLAAGIGALAFAIDDSHATNIGWIANRYSLLAALFGALSVVTLGSKRATVRWLSAPLWLLAILSGEASLSFVAFFAAWVWLHEGEERRATFMRTLPHAFILVVWIVAYKLGGYGVNGSGFYIDPASTPLAFLAKSVARAPILFAAQVTGIPAEITGPLPNGPFYVAGALGLVVAFFTIRWIDRACEGSRRVRALLGAAIVGLVPVTATAPDDRLLLVPGIAILGALGMALARKVEQRRAGGGFGAASYYFVFAHFVLAPLLFVPRQSFFSNMLQSFVEKHAKELPSDEKIVEQRLFILATPDPLLTSYMFIHRVADHAPRPRSAHVLSVGTPGELLVERTSPNTLELSSEGGLVGGPFARLYRAHDFEEGQKANVGAFEADVIGTAEGGLRRVVFTFAEPLESARFVIYGENGFREVTIPAVGESARYEGWDFNRAVTP